MYCMYVRTVMCRDGSVLSSIICFCFSSRLCSTKSASVFCTFIYHSVSFPLSSLTPLLGVVSLLNASFISLLTSYLHSLSSSLDIHISFCYSLSHTLSLSLVVFSIKRITFLLSLTNVLTFYAVYSHVYSISLIPDERC